MSDLAAFEALTPPPRKSSAETVAENLLELVRTGILKAGDRLPSENEMAKAMQVSRPVVREALRGLSILGIVESRQGGRCHVTDLSPSRLVAPLQMVIALDEHNVDALYEARTCIECDLIGRCAEAATEGDLAQLEKLVAAGRELVDDPTGFRVLDLEFHRLLMSIPGNPFLERAGMSMYHLGIEYRRVASATPGVIARSAEEHAEIVSGIANRDADAARAAMRAHLESITATTLEAMRLLDRVGAAGRGGERR